MDFPQRVYSAHYTAKQQFNVETQLLELQVPNGTWAEILRVWVTPDLTDGGPSFQEARLRIGVSGTPATGGTAVAAQELQGGGDEPATCTILRGATEQGVQNALIQTSMSLREGFVWVPHPDERPMITSNATDPGDNFNVRLLKTGSDDWATIDLVTGFTWRELS